MGQASLGGVDVQHGLTAQPPAQPGSIWVAAGRSAAEPAAAELGQDPPLPMPLHDCSEAALHSIWAATWAVHRPSVRLSRALGECVHTSVQLLLSPPHSATGGTTSARLG